MTEATANLWIEIRRKITSDHPDVRLNGLIEARKRLTATSNTEPELDAAINAGIIQLAANNIEDSAG